ncbi:hypothetical protein T07_9911 [Trichinella nelsoni]|uniref:Uncharacterized protein n=1 Tax=Trichinella nelsoni TaxID=6336 RepID=A0A0V0RUY9_9BILA|nr:hypothetical protein T07_9911 [Trichinella nelsoni]
MHYQEIKEKSVQWKIEVSAASMSLEVKLLKFMKQQVLCYRSKLSCQIVLTKSSTDLKALLQLASYKAAHKENRKKKLRKSKLIIARHVNSTNSFAVGGSDLSKISLPLPLLLPFSDLSSGNYSVRFNASTVRKKFRITNFSLTSCSSELSYSKLKATRI